MTYQDQISDSVNQSQSPEDYLIILLSEFSSLVDDISYYLSANATAANGCCEADTIDAVPLFATAMINHTVSHDRTLDMSAVMVVADIGMSICIICQSKKKRFKSSNKHISSGQLLTKNTIFKSPANDAVFKDGVNDALPLIMS